MRPGLLLAPLLLLTACGGGDGVSSGQDVADLIGCTGFKADSDELFVTEGGPCSLDGKRVTAYYFADNDARDSYLEVASGFGGQYLVGDHWAVDAGPAMLDQLRAEVGGEVKP